MFMLSFLINPQKILNSLLWVQKFSRQFGKFHKNSNWSLFLVDALKREVAHLKSSKMFEKKFFVIGVVITYTILLALAFVLRKENSMILSCHTEKPCVRFCCDSKDTCSDDYIKKNFNGTLVPNYLLRSNEEQIEGFRSLFGKPDCSLNLENVGENYTFKSVMLIKLCNNRLL